tara:strand:+ start:370 stop:576 length:207 start_codon:yes stop_codon:yes gene_type:complete
MKFYLHIYVNSFLEYQSVHSSENDAKKEYIGIRNQFPGGEPSPSKVVTWEIISVSNVVGMGKLKPNQK